MLFAKLKCSRLGSVDHDYFQAVICQKLNYIYWFKKVIFPGKKQGVCEEDMP